MSGTRGDRMHEKLYDEMYRLESEHWWFRAKCRIVLTLLETFAWGGRPGNVRVCDLGCGAGMMLSELAALGCKAIGIDASDKAVSYCARRGVRAVKGKLPGGIDAPSKGFDAVLLLDVLEHIADDRGAFLVAAELVKPGGVLVCTVPAYRWLWTRHDVFHHHRRRYTLTTFRRLLRSHPDGRVVLVSYMNTVLFPLALVHRLFRKVVPPKEPGTDMHVPRGPVNRLLEAAFAVERLPLGRKNRLPFGLSLVGVVRMTADEDARTN